MRLEITPVTLPPISDLAGSDFADMVDLANSVSLELWGSDDFLRTPEDEYPDYRPQDYWERLAYIARLDGLAVGRLVAAFPLEEDATGVEVTVEVSPAARGRGIGSALLARAEDLAADGGRSDVSVYTEHPVATIATDADLVRPTVGAEGLPKNDHSVRFVLARGYRLGQVEVSSELAVPLDEDRIARFETDACTAAGSEYRVLAWWEHAPDELVDGFAALSALMTRDVPHDGITLAPESWDAARVRAAEQRALDRGEPLLTSAAVHVPTGQLVGYTQIAVAPDSAKVEQYDTLVAEAHRGHRLGMLLKIANLRELARAAPAARRLLTWNAGENSPMLAINAALGFRPHGRVGNWQKHLD